MAESPAKEDKRKRALLVIDMLNGFLEPDGSLYCGDAAREIIPYVRQRIEEYEGQGEPVIFLCDRHAEDDPEFDLYPAHCVRGTPEAEIVDELPVPEDAHVVDKTTLSPFYGTRLDEVLGEIGPDVVEVVGVCTNICILYAAMDLKVREYDVRVPRKGVATFDADAHEYALQQMDEVFGAEVV
jgi:nicotinamidase-related amidase